MNKQMKLLAELRGHVGKKVLLDLPGPMSQIQKAGEGTLVATSGSRVTVRLEGGTTHNMNAKYVVPVPS